MLTYLTASKDCAASVQCAVCGGWIDSLFYPVHTDKNGRTTCEACKDWFICYGCGEEFDLTDQHGGSGYCDSCWDDHYFVCDGCGGESHRDNLHDINGRSLCSDCARNESTWDIPGWNNTSGKYGRVGSKRCFGIEVETDDCNNHTELNGNSAWGCHHDCSVHGEEFVSAVLSGDDGLDEVDALMDFAASNDWSVDYRCGLHIHLDASAESDDSLFGAAYAYLSTYDVWSRFVDSERLDNTYCGRSSADCEELAGGWRDFDGFAACQSRYEWVNFAAYNRHTTFEVRLHEGTLDGCAIRNWIRAHTTFMDWACRKGCAAVRRAFRNLDTNGKFALIVKIWTDAGCADLADYYGERGGFELTEAPAFTVSNDLANRIGSLVSARW